jgi:hypothetical protein
MAERSMSWALIEETGILTVTHKDVSPEKAVDFDLNLIFEDFKELEHVQKQVIAYGVKQRLSDKTAKNSDEKLTVNERIVTMSNIWNRLSVDRIFKSAVGDKNTLSKKLESGIAEGKIPVTPELLEALRKMGVKC